MHRSKLRILISLSLVLIVSIVSYLMKDTPLNTMAGIDEHPIYSVNREDKVVALTFDINWTEKDNIYSILDTLDKYNVKGTFFIIGFWVTYNDENISKLKAINERGHEIGNHSYKHLSFTSIGEDKIKEELKKTDEVIKEYTGVEPKLFRFPSGDYNTQSVRLVVNEGYIPIQWDVDSVDWKELGADVEYKRVMDNVKPGSIILFHNNAKYTPENLDRIISELTKKGYSFVTVSDLVYKDKYIIDENGVQQQKK